jgi:hypothetical protein
VIDLDVPVAMWQRLLRVAADVAGRHLHSYLVPAAPSPGHADEQEVVVLLIGPVSRDG